MLFAGIAGESINLTISHSLRYPAYCYFMLKALSTNAHNVPNLSAKLIDRQTKRINRYKRDFYMTTLDLI